MKFPDDYIVRFFFKEGLHKQHGDLLEVGCEDGNNLMLFFQYGYNVTGIDISKENLDNAAHNLSTVKSEYGLKNLYTLLNKDMREFFSYQEGSFDIVAFPNCLCYISYEEVNTLLDAMRKQRILKEGGLLFIRLRNTDDYRFNKGENIATQTIRLTIEETGEKGAVNSFFTPVQLLETVKNHFSVKDVNCFETRFENRQSDTTIINSDIVFWCKVAYK